MKKIISVAIVAMFIGMMFVGSAYGDVGILSTGEVDDTVPSEYKDDLTMQTRETINDGVLTNSYEYGKPDNYNNGRTEFLFDYDFIKNYYNISGGDISALERYKNVSTPVIISFAEYRNTISFLIEIGDYNITTTNNITISLICSIYCGWGDNLKSGGMFHYQNTSMNSSFEIKFSDVSKNAYIDLDGKYDFNSGFASSDNIDTPHLSYEFSIDKDVLGFDVDTPLYMQISFSHYRLVVDGAEPIGVFVFPLPNIIPEIDETTPVPLATIRKNPYDATFAYYDVEDIAGKRYVIGVVTNTGFVEDEAGDIIVKSNYNFVFPATRKMTVEFVNCTGGSVLFGQTYNGGIERIGGWFPGAIVFVWLDGTKYQLQPDSPGLSDSTYDDSVYEFIIPTGKTLNKIEIILKPSFWDKMNGLVTKSLK